MKDRGNFIPTAAGGLPASLLVECTNMDPNDSKVKGNINSLESFNSKLLVFKAQKE